MVEGIACSIDSILFQVVSDILNTPQYRNSYSHSICIKRLPKTSPYIPPYIIEKSILQIRKAQMAVYDTLSYTKYGKSICELSTIELLEIAQNEIYFEPLPKHLFYPERSIKPQIKPDKIRANKQRQ